MYVQLNIKINIIFLFTFHEGWKKGKNWLRKKEKKKNTAKGFNIIKISIFSYIFSFILFFVKI